MNTRKLGFFDFLAQDNIHRYQCVCRFFKKNILYGKAFRNTIGLANSLDKIMLNILSGLKTSELGPQEKMLLGELTIST